MQTSRRCASSFFLLFTLLAMGCAKQRPAASTFAPDNFPFTLVGSDASVRMDFTTHPKLPGARPLGRDEICYIDLDPATLVSTSTESWLMFGDNDGVPLLLDNPLPGLRAPEEEPDASEAVRLYGSLFQIAGSFDRVPAALADYLADPGDGRNQAIALAHRLAKPGSAHFIGLAHGGTFSVTLQLTDDGRDKLIEALQGAEDETGIWLTSTRRPQPLSALRCHIRGSRLPWKTARTAIALSVEMK